MLTKAEIQAAVEKAAKDAGADLSGFRRHLAEALGGNVQFSGARGAPTHRSFFDQLMTSDAFKSLEREVSVKGGRVNVGPVTLEGISVPKGEFRPAVLKATLVSSDFALARQTLAPVEPVARSYHMRDILPFLGASAVEVNYSRLTGCSNSAGGVAETAAKPESEINVDAVTRAAKTIATWIPYSRQAAMDVPAFASFLNRVLLEFLLNEEDDQIINGAGGNDLSGILNDPDIQLQPFSNDIIETVRKAITRLQTGDPCLGGGWEPTAIAMTPADWEATELIKDLDDRYLLIPSSASVADGGPQPPRLWRVPVVVTPALPAGTALLGAWDVAAQYFTYEDALLRVSDSHSDFFVRNLVAALVELRSILAIQVPAAIVQVATA